MLEPVGDRIAWLWLGESLDLASVRSNRYARRHRAGSDLPLGPDSPLRMFPQRQLLLAFARSPRRPPPGDGGSGPGAHELRGVPPQHHERRPPEPRARSLAGRFPPRPRRPRPLGGHDAPPVLRPRLRRRPRGRAREREARCSARTSPGRAVSPPSGWSTTGSQARPTARSCCDRASGASGSASRSARSSATAAQASSRLTSPAARPLGTRRAARYSDSISDRSSVSFSARSSSRSPRSMRSSSRCTSGASSSGLNGFVM